MAKKTNALVFRYGVISFWKNQNIHKNFGLGMIQIENIIYQELLYRGLSALVIYYKQIAINIFVFSQLSKVANDTAIFVVSKLAMFWFFFFSMQLFYYFWVELKALTYCGQVSCHTFILAAFYRYFYFSRKKSKQGHIGYFFEFLLLEQSRSFMRLKLLGSNIAYIIFSLCKKTCRVFLSNIFFTKGFFLRVKAGKNRWALKMRGLLYTVFLAIEYGSSRLLSNQLATMLTRGKQHYQQLKTTVRLIKKHYMSNRINFLGFRVDVSGKLAGRMRKRKYRESLGKLPLQTVKLAVSYCLSLSYTKFGVMSIKVWIVNARY